MRSWRLQEHQLKNLLPNWILRMWVVKKKSIKKRTERNLFFVLNERCLLHLQARRYIKSLPKIEKKDLQKVFSTTNPQGQMLSSVFWVGQPASDPSLSWFLSRVCAGAHVAAGPGEQGHGRWGPRSALLHWVQRSGGRDGSAAVRPLAGQRGPASKPVET